MRWLPINEDLELPPSAPAPLELLERFIDGSTLKDLLKQRQGSPLSPDEAMIYLKPLCAALGYAHANGVVHCDVKPGNVMVERGGSVYLTDFGIARHVESTTTMGSAGTLAYMAPEQIRGETVSPATDIYALGVLLYELLAGQRPFRGSQAGTEKGGTTANERIRYGHLNLPPPDPRTFNPSLPAGLAAAILKALAKSPKDRYASTLDFFNAVCLQSGETAANVPDRVAVPVVGNARQKPEQIPAHQTLAQPAPTSRRRSGWLAAAGIAVCVLAVIALVYIHPGTGSVSLSISPPVPKTTSAARPVSGLPNVLASRTTDSELNSLQSILQSNGITPGELLQPGSQSYTATMQNTDRRIWNWGWCASSPIFLQKTLNAIQVEFLIDGVLVPGAQIRQNQGPSKDSASGQILYCYQWASTLADWHAGAEVQLDIHARFLSDINDGTTTYPKGDYVQHITVNIAGQP